MNLQELKIVKETSGVNGVIKLGFLTNKNERTLLYGYTCDRKTFHVYIKDNEIKTVVYGYKEKPYEITPTINESYIPDKRVYPEDADFEFCSLLKQAGVYIPFTNYSEERATKLANGTGKYSGKVL